MNREVAVIQRRPLDVVADAMTPESIVGQVALIQTVMKDVMRPDEHYGVIPGTGTKPTLLKPGAEKLSLTFRLAPTYDVERCDLPNGHREYIVTATLTHIPSGQLVGQGLGSCSTLESKYRYRKAEQTCPACGKPTIIKGRQEYGGGWLCYRKKGGCGEKYNDGDPRIENQEMDRVEYADPADYYNTVLKMAKKRAHVDAVLTATAASDIFTQDVEDLPKTSEAPKPANGVQAHEDAKDSTTAKTKGKDQGPPKKTQGRPQNGAQDTIQKVQTTAREAGLSYDEVEKWCQDFFRKPMGDIGLGEAARTIKAIASGEVTDWLMREYGREGEDQQREEETASWNE